jgi:hypothetical protein
MNISYLVLSILFFAMGWFIFKQPKRVIELQQKFYAMINWRMEPIDMAKEIRNTRIMGLMLIVFILLSAGWVFLMANG